MILRTKGKPFNVDSPLVGRVTRNALSLEKQSFLIVEDAQKKFGSVDCLGVLTTQNEYQLQKSEPVVYQVPSLAHLSDGDLVSVGIDGNINTLYRVNSNHNTILTTERCNSNCLMCSQPPRDKNDIPYIYDITRQMIPLIPKDCQELGISGGEPTLMGELFFTLLEQLKNELPNTELHILTNGRTFAWNNLAERLGIVNHRGIMLGIPLYSDFYQEHDFIVQAKNAFYQTVIGLHNLARYEQRIEIRIVLHKLSIPRLKSLAKFIYKNFPFIEHCAFMGLEHIGYTPFNMDKLWIDPKYYQTELFEAVDYLSNQGINVSIYNTPLCLLPEPAWKYARKSISDWKNDYLPQCGQCSKINECGGFFTWNLKKHSQFIRPIAS